MVVLVVGGAGYIGSHMVQCLIDEKAEVHVLDDLSAGFEDAVSKSAYFHKGCLSDIELVKGILEKYSVEAVMHFASSIQVGESVCNPSKYYKNNFSNTLLLLDAMVAANVNKFIFSSTAATFGNPLSELISEEHPQSPINPYGMSKLMVERVLEDYERAYGLKSVCLRYFNACGAHSQGGLGERHEPETHLIPLILQAASGRRSSIAIFGDDYDTPDGTCIRDYIHVEDLCNAHLLALKELKVRGKSAKYNLGNGNGFSVKEVIEAARSVSKVNFDVDTQGRREGDPSVLVADSGLIKRELGWTPKYADLRVIIEHAWEWEIEHFCNGVYPS